MAARRRAPRAHDRRAAPAGRDRRDGRASRPGHAAPAPRAREVVVGEPIVVEPDEPDDSRRRGELTERLREAVAALHAVYGASASRHPKTASGTLNLVPGRRFDAFALRRGAGAPGRPRRAQGEPAPDLPALPRRTARGSRVVCALIVFSAGARRDLAVPAARRARHGDPATRRTCDRR